MLRLSKELIYFRACLKEDWKTWAVWTRDKMEVWTWWVDKRRLIKWSDNRILLGEGCFRDIQGPSGLRCVCVHVCGCSCKIDGVGCLCLFHWYHRNLAVTVVCPKCLLPSAHYVKKCLKLTSSYLWLTGVNVREYWGHSSFICFSFCSSPCLQVLCCSYSFLFRMGVEWKDRFLNTFLCGGRMIWELSYRLGVTAMGE